MKRLSVLFVIVALVIFPDVALSQSALGSLESMTNTRVNIPAASGPMPIGSATSAGSAAKSVLNSSSSSISSVVAGAVMQSLLNNLLSPTPQKSQAEIDAEKAEEERVAYEAEMARQAEEARQQELHDNLINSSKTLSGSESLDFKSLDGDMETMRKTAGDPFDQGTSGSSLKPVPGGE